MTKFIGPVASTNFTPGRRGGLGGATTPSYIVMHTMDGTIASTTARFKSAATQESAHYGVGLDGSAVQWVLESDTAYHAGSSQMNLQSIGIQHEDGGTPDGPRTDALYAASGSLVKDLCQRYSIPITPQRIIKHSEVSGAATNCPGALDVDRIISIASDASGLPAEVATMSTNPSPVSPGTPPVGDPLRDIATAVYGDPNRWQDIYKSIQGVVNEVPALLAIVNKADAGPPESPPSEPPSSPTTPPSPQPADDTGGASPKPPTKKPLGAWGGSPGAIFSLQVVYLLILAGLAIVYFTDRSLINLPESLGPLPLAIPWFGALGAVLISLVGVTEHRGDWDPTYRFWHWARPLLGASFGSISVLIFQAGILAVGTQPSAGASNVPKDLLYYLIAFIVGYREETFRDLIKKLADVIFSPGPAPTGLMVTSMTPLQGSAAGGTSVTIVGSGLTDADSVRFGTALATSFQHDGDSQLTAASPAGTTGTTVNVVVAAKSANAIAGSFTYVNAP